MLVVCSPLLTPSQLVIQENVLLLVEGRDDQALFAEIAIRTSGPSKAHILDMNGHDKWRPKVAALLKDNSVRANVTALGLIQDADTNPSAAWARCIDALRHVGLPIPARRGNHVNTKGAIRTGVLILPGLRRRGAVEKLCIDSWTGEPGLGRSIAHVDGISSLGLPRVKYRDKAVVQSYLAIQRELARSLAVGFRRPDCIDLTAPPFRASRLFVAALSR